MVVGQAHDPGAEANVLGALGEHGEQQLGRGDRLGSAGVMLADPRLVVAETIECLDERDISLVGEVRATEPRVERGDEDTEPHSCLPVCDNVSLKRPPRA